MNQTVSYFDVLFLRCGVIGHILWALSVITGVLIVRQLLAVRPKILLPGGLTNQLAGLVGGGQVNQAMELAGRDDSLLGYMVHAALMESPMGYQAMERAMEEALDQQTASILRKLEWLNVVGNIGPMLGLMGTVWGMIMAFVAIWETGGIPDPSNLAGAIGIALVTTANVDWTFRTREAFRTWLAAQPPDREWIAEDFRSHLEARNWIAPSHPNAWGALFGWIARSGLVVDAGRLERMTQPRSHARRSPVYRKA